MLPLTSAASPTASRGDAYNNGKRGFSMDSAKMGRAALAAVGVIGLMVFSFTVFRTSGSPLSTSALASIPNSMRVAVIADLDKQSRMADAKGMWGSIFKTGTLMYDAPNQFFSIEWDEDKWLHSRHAEGVRGLELSELVSFGGRLLTCDDRSGIIFEVLDARGDFPRVVPRHIMMEGDGNTDKGFKCEWMAVKGDKLYVGSFGKEYTTPDGGVKNRNNMWVMVFNAKFDMVREDWVQQFTNLREHFGYAFPAYLLHETVMWSETRSKWVFLPRRMSKEAYNDVLDESKGANTVMLANEAFTDFESFTVGTLTPTRGFSTAKFVPGSREGVVVAIKSEENAELNTQASYITVFNMKGEELMRETQIPGRHKYEGVEFL